MLCWVGKDQPMKMRETSRDVDKKLHVNNNQKTAILLETIGKNMAEDPDFVALWLESEASLKDMTLDMFNIDRDRFILIEHDRAGAGEEAVNRLEAYLAAGVADMVVINSLKCLVPSEEFKKDMNSLQVGVSARFNGKMIRKLTAIVDEYEIAMVIVQHLTTQIGIKICA